MSRLVSPIIKLTKEKVVRATIIDVLGDRCSVRLSGRGSILRALKFVGTRPAKDDIVQVSYKSGTPTVYTNSENIEEQIAEVQRQIESAPGSSVITVPPSSPEVPAVSQNIRVHDVGDNVDVPGISALLFPEDSLIDLGDGHVQINITGGGGGGGGDLVWSIDGELVAMANVVVPILITRATTISKVYMYLEDNGSAGSTIIDVNSNGSTIFPTATKPTLAHNSVDPWTSAVPDVMEFDEGDVLTLDIDSLATDGRGLVVVLQIQQEVIENAGIGRRMFSFTYDGELMVHPGKIRMYNKFGTDLNFTQIFAYVDTAPTGASIKIDIHKNGTTIFTTQSNRPEILAGAHSGSSAAFDDSAFDVDDYITMDVDQVGSTLRGENLTVHVVFE